MAAFPDEAADLNNEGAVPRSPSVEDLRSWLAADSSPAAGTRLWCALASGIGVAERRQLAQDLAELGAWTLDELMALPTAFEGPGRGALAQQTGTAFADAREAAPRLEVRPWGPFFTGLRSRSVAAYADAIFDAFRLEAALEHGPGPTFRVAVEHEMDQHWEHRPDIVGALWSRFLVAPLTGSTYSLAMGARTALWTLVSERDRRAYVAALPVDELSPLSLLLHAAEEVLRQPGAAPLFHTLWARTATPRGRVILAIAAGADAPWFEDEDLARAVVEALADAPPESYSPEGHQEVQRFLRRYSHRLATGAWLRALVGWCPVLQPSLSDPAAPSRVREGGEVLLPALDDWWSAVRDRIDPAEFVEPLMAAPLAVRDWILARLPEIHVPGSSRPAGSGAPVRGLQAPAPRPGSHSR